MEYPVIVEQKNGIWRAVIPALADLCAEGASRDKAMKNAQRAAEDYLLRWRSRRLECRCRENKSPGWKSSGAAQGDRSVCGRR